MVNRVDPKIAEIIPRLPWKDPTNLTPKRACDESTGSAARAKKNDPLPIPSDVADLVIQGAVAPIGARRYRPARMPAPTVVFFHGGGWVAGDVETNDRSARTLCIELEAVVLSVEYRRPPETLFPGTFDDCLAALRWAAANVAELGGDANRLAVAGESSGATLAASVAQACREKGPRIVAQLLAYLPTDLVGHYRAEAENTKYPSRAEYANDYFLTADAMHFFSSQYVPSPEDARDPRASPIREANLMGLPPAVVCTAEFDPVRDEGEAYAKALEKAGTRVVYYREPTMIHGYFILGTVSPAALEAAQRARAAFKIMLNEATCNAIATRDGIS
jgi:acetyl esterase